MSRRATTDRDRIEALIGQQDPDQMVRYAWQVTGYIYKQGNSDPLQLDVQEGEIEASHPAVALIELATGHGPDTTGDNTPDWGFESDHEVTVTLRPIGAGSR